MSGKLATGKLVLTGSLLPVSYQPRILPVIFKNTSRKQLNRASACQQKTFTGWRRGDEESVRVGCREREAVKGEGRGKNRFEM